MKIKQLTIRNFKGFESKQITFNESFNVLIGENASGKTSILDACAVAMGSFLRGLDVAKNEDRGINRDEIRVKLINKEPKPQLPVWIEAKGKLFSRDIEWYRSVEKITKKTTTTFVGARNIEEEARQNLAKSRDGAPIIFPVLAYHGTGRLWAEHEKKKTGIKYTKNLEGVSQGYLNCLSPKSSSKEFLSWYKTTEDEIRKFKQNLDHSLLDAFNQTICRLVPDERWQEMAFSFAEDDLIGTFTDNNGAVGKLRFRQLSDGYRNLIGLAADISYRCLKLNPHLGGDAIKETPGIVLIDEIDLHLHPQWQKRIVGDLKKLFPKIQFIVTTHSPFIIQSVKSSELIILDSEVTTSGEPFKKSIEDISAEEMGVEDVTRSKKFLEMMKTAEEYFRLIRANVKNGAHPETIQTLREKLNRLEEEYSDDPGFVALLKIESSRNKN